MTLSEPKSGEMSIPKTMKRNSLVESHRDLAVTLADRMAKAYPGLEREDLIQEALLALTIASKTTTNSRESDGFQDYAATCINDALNGYQLSFSREAAMVSCEDENLEEYPDENPSMTLEIERQGVARRLREILKNVFRDAPEELCALELRFGLSEDTDGEEMQFADIGRRIDRHSTTAHQRVKQGLATLRNPRSQAVRDELRLLADTLPSELSNSSLNQW